MLWRGVESNHRPSGYEPDELTTALPRYFASLPIYHKPTMTKSL